MKELKEQLAKIPNDQLAKAVEFTLSQLAKTGGKSFVMSVPPRTDDTDVMIHELVERFSANRKLIDDLKSDIVTIAKVYTSQQRKVLVAGTEFIVIGSDPHDSTLLICVRPLKDCSKEARETHDNTIRRIPLKQIKEIK